MIRIALLWWRNHRARQQQSALCLQSLTAVRDELPSAAERSVPSVLFPFNPCFTERGSSPRRASRVGASAWIYDRLAEPRALVV